MQHSSRGALWLLLVSLLLTPLVLSVKEKDFKTCSQSGFCRRGRALAERANLAGTSWVSPYSIDDSSIAVSNDKASALASVKSSLYPDVNFSLEVRVHDDGVVRVRMDEVDGLRKRYDEAAGWALISEPVISQSIQWVKGKKELKAVYGEKKDKVEVIVQYEPFKVVMLRAGKEQVVLNGQGLLHMEHFRTKNNNKVEEDEEQVVLGEVKSSRAWFEGEEEDAHWDEKFGTWTDTKPKGTFYFSPNEPYFSEDRDEESC
jgi:mannosyl-oligosaccharide alpha-1,3-glucosidase